MFGSDVPEFWNVRVDFGLQLTDNLTDTLALLLQENPGVKQMAFYLSSMDDGAYLKIIMVTS